MKRNYGSPSNYVIHLLAFPRGWIYVILRYINNKIFNIFCLLFSGSRGCKYKDNARLIGKARHYFMRSISIALSSFIRTRMERKLWKRNRFGCQWVTDNSIESVSKRINETKKVRTHKKSFWRNVQRAFFNIVSQLSLCFVYAFFHVLRVGAWERGLFLYSKGGKK